VRDDTIFPFRRFVKKSGSRLVARRLVAEMNARRASIRRGGNDTASARNDRMSGTTSSSGRGIGLSPDWPAEKMPPREHSKNFRRASSSPREGKFRYRYSTNSAELSKATSKETTKTTTSPVSVGVQTERWNRWANATAMANRLSRSLCPRFRLVWATEDDPKPPRLTAR